MCFKIDWASLIVGSKFTIFASFCFIFDCNFPSTYIWRGDLTEGFLRYRIGGPTFGGAYTWTGIFSEFYGISKALVHIRRTALIIGHLHDGGFRGTQTQQIPLGNRDYRLHIQMKSVFYRKKLRKPETEK